MAGVLGAICLTAVGYARVAILLGIVCFVTSVLAAMRKRGLRSPLDLLGKNLAERTPAQFGSMHRHRRLEPLIGADSMAVLDLCAESTYLITSDSLASIEAAKNDKETTEFCKRAIDAAHSGMRNAMLCFARAVYYDLPVEYESLEKARCIQSRLSVLARGTRGFREGDTRLIVAISDAIDKIEAEQSEGG